MDEDEQSSDDASESDDSDFEEVEVGVEDVALITKLEAELEANSNLYDLHLQVDSDCRITVVVLGLPGARGQQSDSANAR